MDGWTVTQGEERKGARATVKKGEGMCCYGGGANGGSPAALDESPPTSSHRSN